MKIPSVEVLREEHKNEDVVECDAKEKEKHKRYADKRRRAKVTNIEVGDMVLIKQKKSTIKPPWDPKPYRVEKVVNTQIHANRDGRKKVRNVQKCKLLTGVGIERIKHLKGSYEVAREDVDDDWEMDFEKEYRRARWYGTDVQIVQEDQQPVQQEEYQEDDQVQLQVLPELEEVPIRRSTRNRLPPKRYDDYSMDLE